MHTFGSHAIVVTKYSKDSCNSKITTQIFCSHIVIIIIRIHDKDSYNMLLKIKGGDDGRFQDVDEDLGRPLIGVHVDQIHQHLPRLLSDLFTRILNHDIA